MQPRGKPPELRIRHPRSPLWQVTRFEDDFPQDDVRQTLWQTPESYAPRKTIRHPFYPLYLLWVITIFSISPETDSPALRLNECRLQLLAKKARGEVGFDATSEHPVHELYETTPIPWFDFIECGGSVAKYHEGLLHRALERRKRPPHDEFFRAAVTRVSSSKSDPSDRVRKRAIKLHWYKQVYSRLSHPGLYLINARNIKRNRFLHTVAAWKYWMTIAKYSGKQHFPSSSWDRYWLHPPTISTLNRPILTFELSTSDEHTDSMVAAHDPASSLITKNVDREDQTGHTPDLLAPGALGETLGYPTSDDVAEDVDERGEHDV